jgi:threonine dehydrogenase-like Zn-dependent dehydrogenase
MDNFMRALIVDKDGSLSIRSDIPIPKPTRVQALVRVEACGVCNGTDIKVIHRAFKGVGPEQYPLILGHEAVGIVVEIGDKVKSYKVGDRVMIADNDPIGGYGSAWGAFSEYAIVDDVRALEECGIVRGSPLFPANSPGQSVVDKNISPSQAVAVIMFREVLSAIRYFDIGVDKSVAVFGCGPVGQMFIQFMHLLAIGPIIAMDIVDEKLEIAKKCGADYVFNSSEEGFKDRIREIVPNGVDYAIDAVGLPLVINTSLEVIADRGKICCFGVSPVLHADIDWSKAPYNWTLVMQNVPYKEEERGVYSQILVWIEKGVLNPDDYISDRYDFDHVIEAFEKAERKEIAKKCVILFPQPDA